MVTMVPVPNMAGTKGQIRRPVFYQCEAMTGLGAQLSQEKSLD